MCSLSSPQFPIITPPILNPNILSCTLSHSLKVFVFICFPFVFFLQSVMEPQQQQQPPNNEDSGSGKGGFLCRQSSTRWTPTSDQIRILKDLYYTNGVRSPNAEQIQRISARLRQYGKIEGKNVFYWFQNHKARERQKKRFTSDPPPPMQRPAFLPNASSTWKPDDQSFYNKCPNISPGIVSSAGTLAVGQMGNYGYGSVTMEKNFRDCSISAAGGTSSAGAGGSTLHHNFGWVGVDPYSSSSPYALFDKRKVFDESLLEDHDYEEEEEAASAEIETLPLFPMHGEDINGFKTNSQYGYYSGWYRPDVGGNGGSSGGSRTSLELSLNSYGFRSPDSL